jgi:Lysozyme like domain/Domain of unknown function (DUF4214)
VISGSWDFAELEELWLAATGGAPMAPTMAAIALAESGGNPDALNPTDNDGRQSSFGLWQISNGTHTPPDPNWADPLTNARLALGKYQSQGLDAWGTYTSGAYLRFLPSGPVAPVPEPSTSTTPSPGDDMDNLTFIQWIYLELLERVVDQQGFSDWNKYLTDGGSRAQMVTAITNSPEFTAVNNRRRNALGLSYVDDAGKAHAEALL